jgi:hypothetical protein
MPPPPWVYLRGIALADIGFGNGALVCKMSMAV